MKQCYTCKEFKCLDNFHKNKTKSDGHDGRCKACTLTYKKSRREINRYSEIKRKYGISKEDYLMMLSSQGGRCKICSTPKEILCVDHCHKTGKVRGLLCHGCNKGIGCLNDSIHNLQSAITYLKDSYEIV